MNARVSRGVAAASRAFAGALVALLVGAIVVGTPRSRALADDRPGDAQLKGVLVHIEGAQRVTKEKSVLTALGQAHESTVNALKGTDHSNEAIEEVWKTRKLLQHVIDDPRGGGPELLAHVSKAISFADAYLAPVVAPKKPDPPLPLPVPKKRDLPPLPLPPSPEPKRLDPPDRQRPHGPEVGPAPLRGRFRVTMNGFYISNRTNDGRLTTDGPGDEVFLQSHVVTVDLAGGVGVPLPTNQRSSTISGLQTQSGFPTATPWRRTLPHTTGLPPTILFEGDLTQGVNAAVMMPTLWEWDGRSDLYALQDAYSASMDRSRGSLANAVRRLIGRPQPSTLRSWLVAGESLGIGDTMTLDFGFPANRPIGVHPVARRYGFTPQALVLTYDSAVFLAGTDFGTGVVGVVPVRYVEDRWFEGDYRLYLQIERVGNVEPPVIGTTEPAAPDRVSGTFSYRDFEQPDPHSTDESRTFNRPIVQCRVHVWRAGGFAYGTETDAEGRFSVSVPHMPDGTDTTVVLYATNPGAQVLAGFGPFFVRKTILSRGTTPLDFSENFTAPDQIRSFNAAEDIRLAYDFARARRDPAELEVIPTVDVSFIRDEGLMTHYNPLGSGLVIQYQHDRKDLLIMHEYAHFLEDKIGSFLLLPSYHDGCYVTQRCTRAEDCAHLRDPSLAETPDTQLVNSPENAWMEGFADYFAMAVKRANPMGRFNLRRGGTSMESQLDDPGLCRAVGRTAFDGRTITGQMVETYVASALWKLSATPGGDAAVFQIFDRELDGSASLTHWLPNIARFYDAWFARGLDQSVIDRIFVESNVRR